MDIIKGQLRGAGRSKKRAHLGSQVSSVCITNTGRRWSVPGGYLDDVGDKPQPYLALLGIHRILGSQFMVTSGFSHVFSPLNL